MIISFVGDSMDRGQDNSGDIWPMNACYRVQGETITNIKITLFVKNLKFKTHNDWNTW